MTRQPWGITPKTTLGRWSIGLVIAMPILFVISSLLAHSLYTSVPAGRTIVADIAARPALALTMLAAMGTGIAAFIVGLVAIVRQKDSAILVYASTVIGTLVMLFLAGEVVFPH